MIAERKDHRSGFTILEITLVLGILSVLISLTMIVSVNAIGRSSLQTTKNLIVQTLRRAQTLAQNNVQATQWGVYICAGPTVPAECGSVSPSVILFRDANGEFGSYDAVNDQVFELNKEIVFTGDLYTGMTAVGKPGVAFRQITGAPSINGTLTLSLHGEQRDIAINGKGLVEH